jgi:hypothetical protein
MDGNSQESPFELVVFGENFSAWDGPALASLTGARVIARGPLRVYQGTLQLCLETGHDLDALSEGRVR